MGTLGLNKHGHGHGHSHGHAHGQTPGTLCTHRGSGGGKVPGTTCASKPPVQQKSTPHDLQKKAVYLEYARGISYAMQGKSTAQSLWRETRETFGKKGEWEPSALGGAYLRMYLDGKTDADVVAEGGKEIGADAQFQTQVVKVLTDYLQSQATHGRVGARPPERLRLLGDQHMKSILKHPGIALRKELNVIIGGVQSIAVESMTLMDEHSAGQGSVARYLVNIRIGDVYHFNNHREGEQDAFRKKLAGLLRMRDFDKFEAAYNAEATLGLGGGTYMPAMPHIFSSRATHLNDAAIFACFMYALEMNGWTHELPWDVMIPVQITLSFPTPHHGSKPLHGAGGHK